MKLRCLALGLCLLFPFGIISTVHPGNVENSKSGAHEIPAKTLRYSESWGTEDEPTLASFRAWADRYVSNGSAMSSARTPILAEGVQLAAKRRAVLAQLIRSDPERAIAS